MPGLYKLFWTSEPMLLSLASPLSWPILPKLRSQCRSPAVGKVGIVSSPSLLFSMLLPPPHTNTSLQTTSCVQATPWKEARGVQKKSWGEENGFTWHCEHDGPWAMQSSKADPFLWSVALFPQNSSHVRETLCRWGTLWLLRASPAALSSQIVSPKPCSPGVL